MKKVYFVLTCLVIGQAAIGQSTEDSVKMVVDKLFLAMKTSDGPKVTACFADSAVLQTIAKSKEGKVYVKNEKVADFAKQMASLAKGDADERISYDMVKTDADLATVWTPYKFYFKGVFSHCGVNSFQLVRINGQWKIQYLIDTRRKDNCR